MPIIYSYPLNVDILDTDILVGTSTVLVGPKRKNQTKSFSMLDIYGYIVDKLPEPEIPTLQQVTDAGATTTNPISINSVTGIGLIVTSGADIGIESSSDGSPAVYASSVGSIGVIGNSTNSVGVNAYSDNGVSFIADMGVTNTSNIAEFQKNQINKAFISHEGNIEANSFIKTGGVSTEFLKADGTVDSNTYATTSGVVLTTTDQTIAGTKTFSNQLNIDNVGGGVLSFRDSGLLNSYITGNGTYFQINNFGTGGYIFKNSTSDNVFTLSNSGNAIFLGSSTANSFVKNGGTSSQILAADGSVITAGTNITITGGQISSVGGSGGGGSSVNYYLNGGTFQEVINSVGYYEFSRTAVIGTGADFNRNTNGYIASFITDVADPSLLLIPAGNWNLEFFFSSSSAGGSPSFYAELYKYDGTTFTLVASSSAVPEGITNGTAIDAYFTALAVPETVLTVNDRLAIRVFVNVSSKTITLHTQNGHLCEVITTFSAGLTALNGLQAQAQNFAVGTSGTDFAINSSGSTHTFNLPNASVIARGAITTGIQTIAGAKTFTGNITGNSFIKSGGVSTEFLKADGSVDSSTYLTSVPAQSFASLTGKPTTVAGYGITDAVTYLLNNNTNSSVTGTLTETVLATYLMPANTISSNSSLKIQAKYSKPTSLGTAIYRIKINTVNDFATATIIAIYNMSAATNSAILTRNPSFQGGSMQILSPGTTNLSDEATAAATETAIAVNTGVDLYFFAASTSANIGDTNILRFFKITK
jgi:hypothetical protein